MRLFAALPPVVAPEGAGAEDLMAFQGPSSLPLDGGGRGKPGRRRHSYRHRCSLP